MGEALLEDALQIYTERTKKSKETYERAREVFPGGINHNIRFFEPYPLYIKSGKGSRVWDVDGNEYIDLWMLHMGAILGHSHPAIVKALQEQIEHSLHHGFVNEKAIEFAELICDLVPCAEKVRLCCSGTEATQYASRLARAYTGKKILLKAKGGWHGGNDVLQKGVSYPFEAKESLGIPGEAQMYTHTIPFNDTESTLDIIEDHGKDLAGIILEPMLGAGGCIPATREYLKAVKEAVVKHDALLIFDEVITGFKFAGCAQGYYGVAPNLTTLGKTLGGGLPVGSVVGEEQIMNLAEPGGKVWVGGGTFSGNVSTMSTGIATLKYLKDHPDVYDKIGSLGGELRKGIDKIFDEHGAITRTTGIGPFLNTHFPSKDVSIMSGKFDAKGFEYNFRLINYGILFLPGRGGLISAVHSKMDVNKILEVTGEVAGEVVHGN